MVKVDLVVKHVMNVTEVVQLQDNNQHYLEVFYQKQYVLLVKELVKYMKKHVLNVVVKKYKKLLKMLKLKYLKV